MLRYIVKRLLFMIITLSCTIIFVFTLLEFTPGDPAKVILGQTATEDALEAIRIQFGLNDPYIVRLGRYFAQLLRGDLGTSYITRQPIAGAIAARLPLTLTIAFYGILVGSLIGILAGTISAVKQFSLADRVLTFISLFGNSAPSFWIAMLFVLIFAVKLQVLPATGSYGFKYWILPVATIGLQASTASSKGQVEWKVIISHALRNAFIPILTQLSTQFCGYLGGTVLVESVFAIPGIGNYVLDAVKKMDTPVVLSGIVIICAMCSIIILVVDILYAFIDPRIKATYGFGVKKKKTAKAAGGGK